MAEYEDMAGPSGGADNMGGTKQRFFYAPLDYFASIKTVNPAATSLAGKVTIGDTHTFLAGKGFHKIYCTLDKGSVDAEIQGERDGRSYKQSGKWTYPGSEAEVHGFASVAKNDRFIVLAEMPDGKIIQIGTEDFYAEIMGKFGTGTNSSGLRSYEFTAESMGPRNYLYTGAITLYEDEAGS